MVKEEIEGLPGIVYKHIKEVMDKIACNKVDFMNPLPLEKAECVHGSKKDHIKL